MMDYLFGLNNHVALESLNNCLPYEAFGEEAPDISIICFKFWDPVYLQNWTNKVINDFMHPGRFMGFAWNIGDPMTFKELQCNTDLHKRNMVLHRGDVFLRTLASTGYNSVLVPKSDAYFPYFQL